MYNARALENIKYEMQNTNYTVISIYCRFERTRGCVFIDTIARQHARLVVHVCASVSKYPSLQNTFCKTPAAVVCVKFFFSFLPTNRRPSDCPPPAGESTNR